jgi:hypothetical protein
MQTTHEATANGAVRDRAGSVPRFTALDGSSDESSWFGRLAAAYLRRRLRHAGIPKPSDGRTEAERAEAAIRAACVKCAVTGAVSGTVTTAAELLTAETLDVAAIVTVPVAVLTIGSEMVFRAVVHLGLTCDLAEIFGVPFDTEDRTGFWRLFALAFGTTSHGDDAREPGRVLVENVLRLENDDVGASIGWKLVGESVLRNIVPGVAPLVSAVSSWRMTRRVGDTVRRAMRYHRAFRQEMLEVGHRCAAHYGLLAEGLWFLFIADGRLSPEETGVLASLVRMLPAEERAEVTARFIEDDFDWLQRLGQLPENERDDFFHALEVAATVDKVVSLPERHILRSAARALGRDYDEARMTRMVQQFDDVGVLKANAVHA